MPDVSHRGCSIHYEVEGSGPLIVLQHGFWVTDVDVGALAPCYAELSDLSGSEKAVLDLRVPVLLWSFHRPLGLRASAASPSASKGCSAGSAIGATDHPQPDATGSVGCRPPQPESPAAA